MALDKVVAPLLRVPLLHGLRPLQITELARQAERVRFRRGDFITQAGSLGDGAYLIVAGEAERQPDPGSSGPAESIEVGSLVGELAMFVEHVYSTTVVACGRVQCLKLTRAALIEQMREDESLARHFAGVIEERLASVTAELRRIYAALYGGEAPDPSPAPDLPGIPEMPVSPPAATGTDG